MAANSDVSTIRSNESNFKQVDLREELEILEKIKTTLDNFLQLIRWISNDIKTITSNLELLYEVQNALTEEQKKSKT